MFHYYQFKHRRIHGPLPQAVERGVDVQRVKRKFGDPVRAGRPWRWSTKSLAKLLCQNLCCVILSQAELGIEPVFWKGEPKAVQFPSIA